MNVHFVLWSLSSLPEAFPNSPVGGAEGAMFEIAKRLTNNFQVSIHCWGETSREVEDVNIIRYQKTKGLTSKFIISDIFYYKVMRNIRKLGKNQIIHTVNCIEPFFYSDPSFINLLHLENDILPYLPFPSIKKMIYLRRLNRINYVIAVSEYIKKQFQEAFDYPKDNVIVLLNGTDINRFTPNKRNRVFLKEKFGIPEEDFVFFYSGRLVPRKGLHLAIKAFLNINKTHNNVWLLIAGAAPKFFGLGAKTIESIRVDDWRASKLIVNHPRIIYLGAVSFDIIPIYYASANALIIPSIWEDPCPLTCAEAQASSIPVLGTKRGGIPDSVIHRKTGLIFQPNVDEIQENMLQVIEDKELVTNLSKNARKRALIYLNWDNIAKSVQHLYKTALAERV